MNRHKMNPVIINRRASLSLAVYGPFSSNRRRPLSEFRYLMLVGGLIVAFAVFGVALFGL